MGSLALLALVARNKSNGVNLIWPHIINNLTGHSEAKRNAKNRTSWPTSCVVAEMRENNAHLIAYVIAIIGYHK